MTSPRPNRARLVVTMVVLALLAPLAACGGSDSGASSESKAVSETTASEGGGSGDGPAFPVTIEHKYGSTTIEEEPKRIVTVGLTDQDPAIALGVKPVGTTEWYGDHDGALWPWAAKAAAELPGPTPKVIGTADTLKPESILLEKPDLILAVYGGLSKGDYDRLSKIAPTVAQPKDHADYGVPWEEQTEIVGRALGRSDEAERLVADVEDRFAAARKAYPQLDGATALMASPYAGKVAVYGPEDPRTRFLAELGTEQPKDLAELSGDEFSFDLSEERTDLLDVDALLWYVNDPKKDKDEFDKRPIYANLEVHQGNHEVFVALNDEIGGATSLVTVLSLPLLLDELTPRIAAAVDGDGE